MTERKETFFYAFVQNQSPRVSEDDWFSYCSLDTLSAIHVFVHQIYGTVHSCSVFVGLCCCSALQIMTKSCFCCLFHCVQIVLNYFHLNPMAYRQSELINGLLLSHFHTTSLSSLCVIFLCTFFLIYHRQQQAFFGFTECLWWWYCGERYVNVSQCVCPSPLQC